MFRLKIIRAASILLCAIWMSACALGRSDTGPLDNAAIEEPMRWIMGTHLRVAIAEPTWTPARRAAAADSVFTEVSRWDALLSNYRPDSPLSSINQAGGDWINVPLELFEYLQRADLDRARTNGAFDIGAGSPAGTASIETDSHQLRIRLSTPGAVIDPGGNGKGVALDGASKLLRSMGVQNALLDFGGSSWIAMGSAADGSAWSIELRNRHGEYLGRFALRDQALSISASLRQDAGATESAGVPHILDPRTRSLVLTDRLVAVVSATATAAEVLSTALVVDGMAGVRWLERFPESDAVMMDADRGIQMSEGARQIFSNN
jgi:thiamine biosynthesis lipoprotein